MIKCVLILIGLISFNGVFAQGEVFVSDSLLDNLELKEIYKNDQADRFVDEIDWNVVWKKDRLREARVYEMLDSNKVLTSKDYQNAAMIFQHGEDSVAYGMAVKLMRKSIELDSTANKWLLAAAIDRYFLSMDKPQIYGTQYQKYGNDEPWVLGKIDTTKVSDAERIEYGVETLAEQRLKVIQMNKKELSELLTQGQSIDEIISFIKKENREHSKFDLSEGGINNFGYNLMGQEQLAEALLVFKLNTELYPDAPNTYDSYGECLMLVGNKEAAIVAYKRAVELNPDNQNARNIIKQSK